MKLLLAKLLRYVFPFRQRKWPIRDVRGLTIIRIADPTESATNEKRSVASVLKSRGFTYQDPLTICRLEDLTLLVCAAHTNKTSLWGKIQCLTQDEFGKSWPNKILNPLAHQTKIPRQLHVNFNEIPLGPQILEAGFQPKEALAALRQQDWRRLCQLAKDRAATQAITMGFLGWGQQNLVNSMLAPTEQLN